MKGRGWATSAFGLFVALMVFRVFLGARAAGPVVGAWWIGVTIVGTGLFIAVLFFGVRFSRRNAFRLVSSLGSQRPAALALQAIRTDDLIVGIGLLGAGSPKETVRVPTIVVCVFDGSGMEVWDPAGHPRLLARVDRDRVVDVTAEVRSTPIGSQSVVVVSVGRDAQPAVVLPFLPIDTERGLGIRPMQADKVASTRASIGSILAPAKR